MSRSEMTYDRTGPRALSSSIDGHETEPRRPTPPIQAISRRGDAYQSLSFLSPPVAFEAGQSLRLRALLSTETARRSCTPLREVSP
jgi:hypothetical protein